MGKKKKVEVLVTQSCPILCNPIDCSPPGSSIHGISQARILEWVAVPFSSGSSQPRDRTWASPLQADSLLVWATREASHWIEYSFCKKRSCCLTHTWKAFQIVASIFSIKPIQDGFTLRHIKILKVRSLWIRIITFNYHAPSYVYVLFL